MSIHQEKRKRFTSQGAGVFTCGCCKRRTRETNGDHAQTELCEPCFELASIENAVSDRGDEAIAEYRKEALQWMAKLEKLGGADMSVWADLKAQLVGEPEGMDDGTQNPEQGVAPVSAEFIEQAIVAVATDVSDEDKVYNLLMSRPTTQMERVDIKRLTGLGEERCYNVLRKMVAAGVLKQEMHTGKKHMGWGKYRPIRVARYSIA